jgi:hypothetical protein
MKITDLVFDILLEEVRDVGTYRYLLNKWFGENPTDEQKRKVEDLFEKYTQLKGQNRLKPDLPIIVTFLNRFRGFLETDLTQPKKYSFEQMKFLVNDYFGIEDEEPDVENPVPPIFRGKNLKPNEERINGSKSFWFGDQYKIVDEGGFRIYKIPDRSTAKIFGYYQATLKPYPVFNGLSAIPWCIGRYGDDNLYTSYRPRRSFYFVIDESKSPEVETNPMVAQYYVSAVQYSTDSPTNLRITSILNDGTDPVITREDLVRTYPKIAQHLDKIEFMEYDANKELGETTDPVDFVNETNPNSEYFFASISTDLKRRYVIDRKKPITKKISWKSMTPELKRGYFDLTEKNIVYERFGIELFNEIKENKQELKSLESRLSKIGFNGGVMTLGFRLLKNEFLIHRYNISNDKIFVLKTYRAPFKYGVYDGSKLDWYEKGGKKYLPEYNQPKPTILVNKANKAEKFFVELFNKSSEPSSDSFVSIYPIERGKSDKGYFMSYDSYLKMVEDYNLVDQDTDIKPELEKHTDIKEKKGI